MLNTFKTASAYRRTIYPKGGYVLHMLRYLMQDEKGDQNFVDTMHDYVKTYALTDPPPPKALCTSWKTHDSASQPGK